MCYLIAKKYNQRGCIALETQRSKELAAPVSDLGLKTLDRGVQIVTVSDMDVFGEYKPYDLLRSEAEFVRQALLL